MKSSKFTSTPLFPRQALVALLLPLIAEQALSVTIGLADTLMVSSVGEAAVSGVSLVDSFNTLMIQIMSALATGGAVVTSQYIGHQEPKNAKAAAAQILFVLSSFSVLVFQLSLQQFHFGICAIVQLAVQQFLCCFPQGDHPQYTLCRDRRQVNLVHVGVFTVIDLSVYVGVTEILHVRVCRERFCVLVKFIIRDFRLCDFRMDVLNGCFQLLCKVCALDGLDRSFLLAVLRTFSRDLAQHHFGMLRKILVDGVSLRRCAKVYPLCPLHCRPVTLLQEQNVSYNTCVRIALERIVWQANCTDQIGTVGKILSDRGILFIHRTAGSDYRHHAARTNKVKTFCNKVIMDEEVVAVIPLIRHFVIAERHITHHTIKETVRELHCFKALHCNFVLLIKLLCNAS